MVLGDVVEAVRCYRAASCECLVNDQNRDQNNYPFWVSAILVWCVFTLHKILPILHTSAITEHILPWHVALEDMNATNSCLSQLLWPSHQMLNQDITNACEMADVDAI